MSFAFPDIDPNTSGAITHVQVPLDRYLGESFAAGQHDTVLNSLSRISEFNVADDDLTSPILDTETANKKWGVGNLKFTEPVRESVARVMNRRKRDEMDREFFLSQGSSMGRFLPGMAASILGSVSNPLDLGLMFIPFVGEEAAAAKATSVVGRIAARRLITREALKEVFPAAPKLTESVINGMVGQSLFEVPNIVASAQDQANYGPKQAAFNVFAGGAFAAAMHGLGAAMAKLGRGTREEMAKQALNQMLRDETIKVHQYVNVDEAAIWEKIKFDADAARSAAYNSINMDDIAGAVKAKYGETVASPAVKMVDGTIRTGQSHEQILSSYWAEVGIKDNATIHDITPEQKEKLRLEEEGFITDKGRFISREEAGKLVGLPDTGYNHLMWENDKLMSEQISTANPEQLGAAEFDRYNQLIEENPHLSKADALKKIMEERAVRRDRYLTSRTEIQEMIERERVKAIEDFVRQEQVKFEQTKQGRFDAMKQVEIDRQIAEGKILKDEEIQKAIPPEKFDGSADADLEKDVAALKKDLKLDEMGVKPDNSGMIQDLVTGLDKMIKSLDHDPTKMSLPLADLLTLGIGRPVLKALLVAIKEGLLLTNDLIRAIDHAFKKTEGVKDTPELREALTRAINDDTAKPLFTHTIQSELAKLQPFNVKPDRFTPQVIAAKLKQLPAPEQAMLKMAGIDQFMAKYKPTEMIDRPAFEEFVRNAMIEPEIRPMLNLGAEENPNYIKQRLNKVGRYAPREAQHILETAGWKIGPDMAIVAEGKPLSGMDRRLPEQWNDWLKNREKIQNLSTDPNVLYGDFVSQNVSVPIPFEKMEKPRTIFLAADQDYETSSSHYNDVDFGSKNMLAWMETHIVMMPDGRRVLHIFEVQSDVRQSFYIEHNPPDVTYGVYYLDDGTHKGHNQHKVFSTKAEAEKFLEQKIKDYQTWVQPLIDHTDEILMKAALQLAKREGLDGVVISDPRTAMLTQGHLGSISAGEGMGFTDGPWVGPGPKPDYLPPSQAAGMTQAYGNKLPTILRKATRKEGEAVELGGRHYLMEDSETPDVGSKGIEEFNKAFPGSDSPSGQFFPVKDLAPDKPFELFTPKQVEPPKPQLEAINAAVDCILKKVI